MRPVVDDEHILRLRFCEQVNEFFTTGWKKKKNFTNASSVRQYRSATQWIDSRQRYIVYVIGGKYRFARAIACEKTSRSRLSDGRTRSFVFRCSFYSYNEFKSDCVRTQQQQWYTETFRDILFPLVIIVIIIIMICCIINVDAGRTGRGKLTKIRYGRDCAVPSRFGARDRTSSSCAVVYCVRMLQSHCPNSACVYERAGALLSGNKNARRTNRARYQRDIIIIIFFSIVIDFECMCARMCVYVRGGGYGKNLLTGQLRRTLVPTHKIS